MKNTPLAINREEVFSLIENLADIGIWQYHVGTDYLHWDEPMYKLYGVDEDDFTNVFKDWSDRVHPDDIKGASEAFNESIRTEGEFVYTFRIYRKKDKALRYIKANARISTLDADGGQIIVGVNQDVTEFYEMQSEKEEIMETLKDSQETAMIGSWQYYPKTNTSVMDHITKKIYGVPQERHIPAEEGITFYKEGFSRDTIIEKFQHLLSSHEPYDLQLQLVNDLGKELWVRTIGKVKLDAQGEVHKAYGVFQDITEQKEKELALEEANDNLQQLTSKLTEQNRSLNDFAHISSHNLRAPVANLMMLNDLYAESDDQKFREEIFEMVLTSTNDLKNTLDHLLESLVIQSKTGLDMIECNLPKVLRSVLTSLSEIIKHTDAEVERDWGFEKIHAQPIYLDSILLNLVGNAIKYKDPNRQPIVQIKSFMDKGIPHITVKDNGLGIDLERHGSKVFGLHKTFHKNSDAKGVGLYMVKAQMEAMGGSVSLESTPGEGSTFILTFKPISEH